MQMKKFKLAGNESDKKFQEAKQMMVDYKIKLDFPMPNLLARLVKKAEETWDEQGDSFEFIEYL